MWLHAAGDTCSGENAAPCIHHHVVRSHNCLPQRTAYQGVCTSCRRRAAAHARHILILTREQIFTEAEKCVRAELNSREPFTRVYRVGVWFGFVRIALLLAVILCWVDRCFDSWVLLGFFCLLRVTHPAAESKFNVDHASEVGMFLAGS